MAAGLATFAVMAHSLLADEPPASDLLNRPDATIAHGDPPLRLAASSLIDGDASTAIDVPTPADTEVDLSVAWGGAVVALKRVVVGLDPGQPASQPTDLEVLVSADATGDDFHVVKSVDLFGGAGPYQFDIAAPGARRIIVRLRPPAGGKAVRLTELALLGCDGTPTPRYAFQTSPIESLELIARLQRTRLGAVLPPDEATMLEDGSDGAFDEIPFAEAALMASGVADAAARTSQLAAIDQLIATAKRAVANESDLLGKGEQLLRLLHAGPFKGGYELRQTDVSTILQTGRFNCVSSAVLYTIVGRQLGLDVRGIEVPEHAFAILFDGPRHVDIETTIPEGFDPARSPEAAEKFRARTGFVYVPESHREERREVNDAGLVALIYYNHGVTRSEQGDHPGALVMYFRGLLLDPGSAALRTNTLASLTNWSKSLLDAGKPGEAAAVSKAALAIAPRDSDLRTNAQVAFRHWALAEDDAGRTDAALAALAEGLTLLPHDNDLTEAKAGLFTRRGMKHVESGEWQAALDAVAPGLEKLEGRDRARLAEWCGVVRSRWAKAELDAGRFETARDVLVAGLAQHPDDSRVRDNLEYCLDQQARTFFETDWPGAIKAYEAALELLPRSSLLENNLRYCRQNVDAASSGAPPRNEP